MTPRIGSVFYNTFSGCIAEVVDIPNATESLVTVRVMVAGPKTVNVGETFSFYWTEPHYWRRATTRRLVAARLAGVSHPTTYWRKWRG